MTTADVVAVIVALLGGGTLGGLVKSRYDARQTQRLTSGNVQTTEAKDLWVLLRQAYTDAIARVETLEMQASGFSERQATNQSLLSACEAASIQKDKQIEELKGMVGRLMSGEPHEGGRG